MKSKRWTLVGTLSTAIIVLLMVTGVTRIHTMQREGNPDGAHKIVDLNRQRYGPVWSGMGPPYRAPGSAYLGKVSDTPPKGIDVSHWNRIKDWHQVKNTGVTFVYIKASGGSSEADPMFAANVQGARAAGLLVGAYHYAKPSSPYNPGEPLVQADNFVRNMKPFMPDYGDLMPVLDLEVSGGLSPNELAQWTRSFIQYVSKYTGRAVMLYTGVSFIEQENGFEGKLRDIPLWVAAYTRYGYTRPPSQTGWTSSVVWQYSDGGNVPGIDGDVDLDQGPRFLEQLWGGFNRNNNAANQ